MESGRRVSARIKKNTHEMKSVRDEGNEMKREGEEREKVGAV